MPARGRMAPRGVSVPVHFQADEVVGVLLLLALARLGHDGRASLGQSLLGRLSFHVPEEIRLGQLISRDTLLFVVVALDVVLVPAHLFARGRLLQSL